MIRLQRFGKRNQPVYRVVLTKKQNGPRSGNFSELLGFYNPHTKERNLKVDRINHWIGHGAQTSGTVQNLLLKEGVLRGKKVDVSSRKKSKKTEEKTEAENNAEAEGENAEESVKEGKVETPAEIPSEDGKEESKKEKAPEEKKEEESPKEEAVEKKE